MVDESRPTAAFFTTLPTQGTEELLDSILDDKKLNLLRSFTGIDNPDQLKTHIVSVQREAHALRPYTCITYFYFIDLRLSGIPGYERMLQLGRSRQNPIYLDVGCCFGGELRKAILDGYPRDAVIATDIIPEFWDLGHKLFNTTPESFPVPFIAGDAFDPSFLQILPPVTASPDASTPKLLEVKTLNDLRGHVSVISVCQVFHLFETEAAQLQLARALAGILSPEPGSMIIGVHNGLPEKGMMQGLSIHKFCHSPESWTELWDGAVFETGTVKVNARLVERTRPFVKEGKLSTVARQDLEWSVTRL